MSELLEILERLIAFPSITPEDAGCQDYMIQFLENLGFSCIKMNQGSVSNFFAHYGSEGPLLVFAGHTDVVPVGEKTQWHTDPFRLVEKKGILYGRGTADMKGSLACMLAMAAKFIKKHPRLKGQLGFLITSGEEGNDYNWGTPYVMEQLQKLNIQLNYCIVGEPSSTQTIGDVIKIGRRGSLNAKIHLVGKQGHVAYPHLAINPIHSISPALTELLSLEWDKGNEHFPPTSMQITYLHSGGHATNIIPGTLELHLNLRFSTEHTEYSLKEKILAIFKKHQLKPEIEWQLSGLPFLTSKGLLLESCKKTILEITGKEPQSSTSGGTSDGRFIAPYGVEVIELGPVNASIHQVNECVNLKDLEVLAGIYFSIAERIFDGF